MVMASVAALAACGGRESAPPPKPSPSPMARQLPMARPSAGVSLDACQLLTRQEVEAALGKPVGEGAPESMPQLAACHWAARSAPDSARVAVTVYDGAAQARAAFEMAVKINGYRTVRGVGEDAYASPMYDLTVLSGRYELAVDVSLLADEPAPAARRLAQQAVARLPR